MSGSSDLLTRDLSLLDLEDIMSGVRIVYDSETLTVEDGVIEVETETGTVYRWRCTVCGYVHEAPSPPRWCPMCGAEKTQFELMQPGSDG